MSKTNLTRREVIKRAAYVAPVIVTLPALPSLAAAGSGDKEKDKDKKDKKLSLTFGSLYNDD